MTSDPIVKVAAEIIYCANGCSRPSGDDRIPVTTTAPSHLCTRCEQNLEDWLRAIPGLFRLLPTFVEHGTTARNPESKTTKAAEAPAPMRLDIIDMLDSRRGRKWNGLTPTEDRRGVVGELQAIADAIIDARELVLRPTAPTVAAVVEFIQRHRTWLQDQEWVDVPYDTVKQLHRQLSDAVGNYRQRPIGKCPQPKDDAGTCSGPLFANPHGGVRCAKCASTWDAHTLRLLGLEIAQTEQETEQETESA